MVSFLFKEIKCSHGKQVPKWGWGELCLLTENVSFFILRLLTNRIGDHENRQSISVKKFT